PGSAAPASPGSTRSACRSSWARAPSSALRRVSERSEEGPGLTYADAGVDMVAGDELVERIKAKVRTTFRPEVMGDIGGFGGLFAGCRGGGCALIGGETAEHPGAMEAGEFDLAGFVVGVAERDRLLTGAAVRAGDLVLGLPSPGLRCNGYSLARRVLLEDAG